MPHRKIIHIDMDAYFASVEQLDKPELRGVPVAVGVSARRGVVCAASYEARLFGVHSAMPSFRASQLCPHLIFVRPRFDRYSSLSKEIFSILRRFAPMVEPVSIDEAYLDVTSVTSDGSFASRIAKQIKADIKSEIGLTASAGVSYNRFLAKLASGQRKPDGLTVIQPEEAIHFLAELPIGKLPGVGRVTEARMHENFIYTVGDLQRRSCEELVEQFGSYGLRYFQMSRGIDERPIEPERPRKSYSVERTFLEDHVTGEFLLGELRALAERLAQRAPQGGRTVILKVKYNDLSICTRRLTSDTQISGTLALYTIARELLGMTEAVERPVRLLGLGFTVDQKVREKSAPVTQQLSLFT